MEWSIILIRDLDSLQKDIKLLESLEMWLWRRLMKVKWTGHKTNEEVLKLAREKRMLIKTIRERQMNWIGHVLRSDSLLRTIWGGGRVKGKKVAGRPRTKLLDWMIRETDSCRTYKEIGAGQKRKENEESGPV
jgi:hypothetical protein